jgi:hypothetical protein
MFGSFMCLPVRYELDTTLKAKRYGLVIQEGLPIAIQKSNRLENPDAFQSENKLRNRGLGSAEATELQPIPPLGQNHTGRWRCTAVYRTTYDLTLITF